VYGWVGLAGEYKGDPWGRGAGTPGAKQDFHSDVPADISPISDYSLVAAECLADTAGAEFNPDLATAGFEGRLRKGCYGRRLQGLRRARRAWAPAGRLGLDKRRRPASTWSASPPTHCVRRDAEEGSARIATRVWWNMTAGGRGGVHCRGPSKRCAQRGSRLWPGT